MGRESREERTGDAGQQSVRCRVYAERDDAPIRELINHMALRTSLGTPVLRQVEVLDTEVSVAHGDEGVANDERTEALVVVCAVSLPRDSNTASKATTWRGCLA